MKLLSLFLELPETETVTRYRLAVLVDEAFYRPDVAMSDELDAPMSETTEWPTGTTGRWELTDREAERTTESGPAEVRPAAGWIATCDECQWRSPQIRDREADARADRAAHNNIVHEGASDDE